MFFDTSNTNQPTLHRTHNAHEIRARVRFPGSATAVVREAELTRLSLLDAEIGYFSGKIDCRGA
jgi:hypothetical protein